MALVPRIAGHQYDNSDKTVVSTPPYSYEFSTTFTPAAGEMLVLDIVNFVASGTPGTPVPTDTGLHVWTQQATCNNGVRRRTRFTAPDNGSTAASTLTATFVVDTIGCAYQCMAVLGADTAQGTGGIIQNVTGTGSSATPTVTLSAFGNASNGCIFGPTSIQNVSPTSNNLTNATGFPQEDKGATPSQSTNVGFQLSSNLTPSFTWAASAAYLAIGSEIALLVSGGTVYPSNMMMMGMG